MKTISEKITQERIKDKERSGGHWCDGCGICLQSPRKRKIWQAPYFITCDECLMNDVMEIYYSPQVDSLRTHFKIRKRDLPGLIESLIKQNSALDK